MERNKRKNNESDVLGSVLSQMEKENQILKKSRVIHKQEEANFVDILVEEMVSVGNGTFDSSRSGYSEDESSPLKPNGTPEMNSKKCEIEIRAGTMYSNKFSSGITANEFETFKVELRNLNLPSHRSYRELVFIYDYTNGSNLYITVDEKQRRPIKAQVKNRNGTSDVELSSISHALRVSVVSETEQPVPTHLPSDFRYQLRRDHYIFPIKGDKYSWTVDLCRISSLVNGDPHAQEVLSYELKFMLDESSMQACYTGDKSVMLSVANQVWEFILACLNSLLGSSQTHFAQVLQVEKVEDQEHLHNLRETCNAWIPGVQPNSFEFPGSMPVNFTRNHTVIVQKGQYYVSEKTDGIRAMMLIYPGAGVYLIDRKFDFYRMPALDSLVTAFASAGITLLDGEVVVHIPTRKPMYLMFDIIALDGTMWADKKLSDRLKVIGQNVIAPYRHFIDKGVIPKDHGLTLIGKRFLDKSEFHKLFECIKNENGTRVYKDDKRYHKSDGFIFTPDEPYQPRTARNLFKWKYSDELSVDFLAKYNAKNRSIQFFAAADRGEAEFNVHMPSHDSTRLARYLSVKDTCIVECVINLVENNWKLKTLRPDKHKANHISVVKSTIQSARENLGTLELLSLFPAERKHTSPQHPVPVRQ